MPPATPAPARRSCSRSTRRRPLVAISSAAETSNVATQTISGSVTAGEAAVGATVTLLDTVNGVTTAIGTATVGSGGLWTTSVTLSGDGAHSIVAQDTDAAGNTGTSTAVVFTLDTQAPLVTISSAAETSNVATQTISGSVTAGEAAVGATVTLLDTVNGVTTAIGTATVGSGGLWTTSVTLAGDGAHSIVAQDTDAAGNTGTSTAVVFTLDTQAPAGDDQQRRRDLQRREPDDFRKCHRRRGRGRRHRDVARHHQRRHHRDRHRDRGLGRAVDHQRDAGGRWRPLHRRPGHRCRRQHRHQHGGRVHARHAGARW